LDLKTGIRKIIGIGREVEGLRKDGTTFPLELSVAEMQIGDQRMYTGMISDISERKQSDNTLNRLKTSLDQTLDCIFMFEPGSLKFFYANQGAMKQVEYSHEELMNMSPIDIKPDNTISSTRIANADIRYGGDGTLNSANEMGWLAKFFNSKWMPF